MKEQVLTLEEAALYLKVAKPTLYRLLEDGKIPAFKVGNQWRFTRELIDTWLWDQLPKKKNVLVVDDEKLICIDLQKIYMNGKKRFRVNAKKRMKPEISLA